MLGASTVQELFDMANTALGTGATPNGASLSDIANAVDIINNAFDECRIFMGYVEPLPCSIIEPSSTDESLFKAASSEFDFNAYPVPSRDGMITVSYNFDYDTNVNIYIYSFSGQTLKVDLGIPYLKNTEGSRQIDISQIADQELLVKITTDRDESSKMIIKASGS